MPFDVYDDARLIIEAYTNITETSEVVLGPVLCYMLSASD